MMNQVGTVLPLFKHTDYIEETHEKKTAWANIQGINSLHKAGKHTRLAPDLSQSLSSLCYIRNQAKILNQVGTVLPWFKHTDYIEETHEKKTACDNIQCINSLHKAGKHTRLAPDLSQSISSLCYIKKQVKMMSLVELVSYEIQQK
jgi:hypothetical protein